MPKQFKGEEEVKKLVCEDIKNGASVQDLIKKYNVSEYYIRKWSGEVYKQMDLDHFVRYRFKWITLQFRADIENSMAGSMQNDETYSISDETWDAWGEIIKKYLYDYAKEIIKAN